MRQNNRKLYRLAQGAIIVAIYVAFIMVFTPISFGPVQLGIAETFCMLSFFTPATVPGLLVGCLLSNLFCEAMSLDMVFESLATFIGAVDSWYPREHKWCVCTLPIMANAIIIPWVPRHVYDSEDMILMAMVIVGIGGILAVGVLDNTLLIILEWYKSLVFRQQAVQSL